MKFATESALKDAVGLIGKKCGMTQVFDEEGLATAVTVVELLPLVVTQLKTKEKDGYTALQVGYVDAEERHLNKPKQGLFKKNNLDLKKYLQEFRIAPEKLGQYNIGQEIDADAIFKPGDVVKLVGRSIGKGFQGRIRAHHFARGPMSHGSKSHRLPGSIGAGTTPSRVRKGLKMATHLGDDRVTAPNVKIINILNITDPVSGEVKKVVLVKGSVPGKAGATVTVLPYKKVGQK